MTNNTWLGLEMKNKSLADQVIVDKEYDHLLQAYNWYSARGYVVRSDYSDKTAYQLRIHREILGLKRNDKRQVDHINGNKLDNRKSNLRICTQKQNNLNKAKYVTNKSGYKGVSWKKTSQKWCAQISVARRVLHIGLFDTREAAAEAYNKKALELHGEFARTNLV